MTIFQKDRVILEQFRAGDKEALSAVYYFYINDIEALVRSGRRIPNALAINDLDQQQDLIQEIFIRAFSKSARLGFDGLRPYKPYLLSIAKNVIIDYLRKLPKELLGYSFNDEDDEQLIAFFSNGAIIEAENNHSRESGVHWDRCLSASHQYVSSLPDLQQKFIKLRFKEEMPQLTVAKTLRMTRWKVRTLEKKIQSGLKKYLTRAKLIDERK